MHYHKKCKLDRVRQGPLKFYISFDRNPIYTNIGEGSEVNKKTSLAYRWIFL